MGASRSALILKSAHKFSTLEMVERDIRSVVSNIFVLYCTILIFKISAYTHLKGGQVVQGTLVHQKCPAKIKIFSPLDRSDRCAVVILYNHHNHPRFPSLKLSHNGKDKYEAAIKANGVACSTVLKTDNGV